MYTLLLCSATLLAKPCVCYRLINSRDAVTRSVIEACRGETPSEKAQCYPMLRCVMDNVPRDFTARWSAGLSVLAFISTIVGLLSNSINETTVTADESVLLAIALSVSSITAFNRRFGDRPNRLTDNVFEEQSDSHACIQTALSILEGLIAQIRMSRPWWKTSEAQLYISSLVAVLVSAGVWYEVYEITRYGIIVFACPVKANVGMWIGLTQLLTVLNVLCRSLIFDTRIVHIRTVGTRPTRDLNIRRVDDNRSSTVVLRSHRDTFLRWLLQNFTAIASFILYAYGTVLLARMTLIPASDAIRATVMSPTSAGVRRLIGYWFTSPRRKGSQIIVVDVPTDWLQDSTALISEREWVNG